MLYFIVIGRIKMGSFDGNYGRRKCDSVRAINIPELDEIKKINKKRDKIISEDDILNLRIDLEISLGSADFLKKIGCKDVNLMKEYYHETDVVSRSSYKGMIGYER